MLQKYIQLIKPAEPEIKVNGGLQLVRVTEDELKALED
jgi:hypothetical protein